MRSSQGSEAFVSALCREIGSLSAAERRQHRGLGRPATPLAVGVTSEPPVLRNGAANKNTLYFGGGTPSLLSLEQISRITETLAAAGWTTDAEGASTLEEFTVEVNPDDILRGGPEYANGLRRLGVNRISMGVQSFDDTVLKIMGRRHNAAQAVEALAMLRDAGFDNVSLDFIIGFKDGFDLDGWTGALRNLPGGLPEHLSCYQLGIEEGSGLEKMISHGIYTLPSDDECGRQYYAVCAALAALGYEHYEISNWAKPGYRSCHNSSYWDHTPYLGFGPGAHSLLDLSEDGPSRTGNRHLVRRWNNPDVAAYISAAMTDTPGPADFSPVRGGETLTPEQIREEKIMLGLRTSDGVEADLLTGSAGREKVADYIDRGLLCPVPESGAAPRIRIPESRWFISDDIIAEL